VDESHSLLCVLKCLSIYVYVCLCGLLLFDVHTNIGEADDYSHRKSSTMMLLQVKRSRLLYIYIGIYVCMYVYIRLGFCVWARTPRLAGGHTHRKSSAMMLLQVSGRVGQLVCRFRYVCIYECIYPYIDVQSIHALSLCVSNCCMTGGISRNDYRLHSG